MKRALLRYTLRLFPLLIVSCAKDIVDTTGNLVGVISDSRSRAFLSGVSVALTPTGKTYTTGVDGKSGYKSAKRTAYVQAGKRKLLTDDSCFFKRRK